MKSRLSALDIAVIVHELQQVIVGLRLQNIYDLNQKTILLKFSREGIKEFLLVESGLRMHLTQFSRDKSDTPSNFCIKLRKHLRTKRLISIKQLGMDRVVDLQFGQGEFAFHLIFEFYASGNIILTDSNLKIISLLRIVTLNVETPTIGSAENSVQLQNEPQKVLKDEENIRIAVGEIYNVGLSREFSPINSEKLLSAFSQEQPTSDLPSNLNKKSKMQKKPAVQTLKKIIKTKFGPDYGPALVDHIISNSKIDPEALISDDFRKLDSDIFKSLLHSFQEADLIVSSCRNEPQKGWILAKSHISNNNNNPKSDSQEESYLEYDDFNPYDFLNGSSQYTRIEFDNFNKAVDAYFSSIESQKLEAKARQAQANADKKLASVKSGHAAQVAGLSALQEKSENNARAIEDNLDNINSLLRTIRGFISSGMDWVDLAELVKEEARKGNPLAKLVEKLKLEIGLVTVKLPNPLAANNESDSDSSESDSGSSEDSDVDDSNLKKSTPKRKDNINPYIQIDLDINLSAYANARKYFESRKIAVVKQEKTLAAADKAIKFAEKKINIELTKATKSAPSGIIKMRKQYWFEKFLWFISSENYLIVGGKDASQNELLVKRYMKKDDVYVHADLHGASSVIIKNISSEPIPHTTLTQAGNMSVVQSKAWESKIITSAWWVNPSQVSKTAPTGEYLTMGSFMIRGKKNWLPPIQLIYGFGLLFKVDESSIGRHFYERRPWARDGTDRAEESIADKNLNSSENDQLKEVIEIIRKPSTISPKDSSSDSDLEEFPDTQLEQKLITPIHDKYNLGKIENSSESEIEENSEANISSRNKGYTTAKERRDMKKNTERDTDSTTKKPVIEQQSKPVPRGKKGKAKKIKEKYKDQDEDERELVLEFLGAAQGPQPKGKKAKAEALKKAKIEEMKSLREEKTKIESEKPRTSDVIESSDIQTQFDNIEVKRMLEEENVALPDDDQIDDLTYLDSLTGEPHNADILLHAIPVCAPWGAIQKYKYRVKLLPGGLKKGKSSKSVISSFIAVAQENEEKRQLELIKNITDNEVIAQILGKVKISGTLGDKTSKKKK